jgi:hypothetical protein
MATRGTINNRMRIYHRYLGFFLAGIMTVYALSGVIMIFRDTNFLKQEKRMEKKLAPNLSAEQLGKEIRVRDLKATSDNGQLITFKQGSYDKISGEVKYVTTALPPALEKLTQLHKASSKQPLFYLNVFFGVSLLFFVLSSFWMFLPGTSIFKKGMYFTLAGIILTLALLFIR